MVPALSEWQMWKRSRHVTVCHVLPTAQVSSDGSAKASPINVHFARIRQDVFCHKLLIKLRKKKPLESVPPGEEMLTHLQWRESESREMSARRVDWPGSLSNRAKSFDAKRGETHHVMITG